MRAQDILKNSLLNLYADLPEVVELIHQISFDEVDYKFRKELFLWVDKDEFDEVENFLRSDVMKRYTEGVQRATMAVTRDLSGLLDFALLQNEGGKIN